MGKLHYLCLFTRRYSFLQIISNIYLNFLSFNSWLQGSAITASNASIPTQSTRFRTGNLLFWHHCSQRNICIKIMPVPKFTLFEHSPPPSFHNSHRTHLQNVSSDRLVFLFREQRRCRSGNNCFKRTIHY